MDEKKLGLGNVVSISVGLVVATSCLVSLGNGAGTLGSTFIFAMFNVHIVGRCPPIAGIYYARKFRFRTPVPSG